jgi:trk system potassium uptake protein
VHAVIMGCGRVGALLAQSLDSQGHSVAVIDQDAAALRRLHEGFTGITVTGVGFDRDRLLEAQIERADAFAAVSSGDNSNIIAARVAREVFNVPRVVARIYDPRRAEVYERLGIATVATVGWTTDQILRRITPSGAHEDWRDPTGLVTLAEMTPQGPWIGRTISDFEHMINGRVACLVRYSEGVVPTSSTVMQEGDVLHVSMRTVDIPHNNAVFARGPEAGS